MTHDWPKVFISYAREDAEWARRLCRDLTSYGVDVWFDEDSLVPGERWQPAISKAIRGADFVIAILSPQSITKRGYVQKEVRLAIEVLDERPEHNVFLIPARVGVCEPQHERLLELNWVDMFPSWETGLHRITRAFKRSGFELIGITHERPRAASYPHPMRHAQEKPVKVLQPGADPLKQIIGLRHPLRRQLPRTRIAEQLFLLEPGRYVLAVAVRRPKSHAAAVAHAAALGRLTWRRNAFKIFRAADVPKTVTENSEFYSTFLFNIPAW